MWLPVWLFQVNYQKCGYQCDTPGFALEGILPHPCNDALNIAKVRLIHFCFCFEFVNIRFHINTPLHNFPLAGYNFIDKGFLVSFEVGNKCFFFFNQRVYNTTLFL